MRWTQAFVRSRCRGFFVIRDNGCTAFPATPLELCGCLVPLAIFANASVLRFLGEQTVILMGQHVRVPVLEGRPARTGSSSSYEIPHSLLKASRRRGHFYDELNPLLQESLFPTTV
jgi:hypothetical protein